MKYITTLLTFALCLIPLSSANAYFTTGQSAFYLDDTSAIYVIEFSFGHGLHEIHMPVAASDADEKSHDSLSYIFYDRNNNPIEGIVSAGIVLGALPIENGMYVTPQGAKKTFTLLIVATIPENIDRTQVHAAVTHLPFSFNGENELQLNPTELEAYETSSLVFPRP